MKKILALFLAILMSFAVIGCDVANDENSQTSLNESSAVSITVGGESSETSEISDEASNGVSDGVSDEESSDISLDTSDNESSQGGNENSQPEDSNKDESKVKPLLYKVTDQNGNTVWLFGSIHIGIDDYYPLPDYVMDAYKSSDALAVEADIVAFEKNTAAQMSYIKGFLYTDGTTIKDHVSNETYDNAVKILKENNYYAPAFDSYMPTFWQSLISDFVYKKIGADSSLGIDRYFLNLAKKDKKQILEIESAEFQGNLFASFSEELQEILLDSAIHSYNNIDENKETTEDLLELWGSGDEKKFSEYLNQDSEVPPEEIESYNEYNYKLIDARNKCMTKYAVNALESGKEVFICVGAAHVVGDGAMVEFLRDMGYTVELVK